MNISAQKFTKVSLLARHMFLSLVICYWLLVIAAPAHASDVSMVVSPPRIDIEGKPGETYQKTIKVTNSSDKELILKAMTIDFIVQDDAGTPTKVSESASGRYLASPWFTLDRSELVIPAKGTEQLIVAVTVPKDALPGGHYAGVFFEPQPARDLKQTVSYTSTQVGSLFGITVAGDIKYDALIKDFHVGNNLYEYGPVAFAATIENQSDTHISPKSKIVIHDMLGRQLEEVKLDDLNIFPYTSRTLKGAWETVWGLGRYTATLSVAYGPGLEATRTLYFWILPYRLIAAILVVLGVILVTVIAIRRHLAARFDTRDAEIDELKRKIIELENQHH